MAESPRERWAEIERLLDQALELLPVDRAAFLERVCAGDLVLRAEVERLLRAAEAADMFLEEPAPTYAAPLLARLAEGSAPAPGARLGNYEILRELGRGGMATVYLASDLKLERQVALKVLRPELAAVLGAERFLQEIRISAKLDHPHILTLIDSGESDGFVWYVLPYVRGESLRDKLTREKQLSLDETVRIATQVASALDYAHRHGVIHRDIKPENILLHEGEAVVADFGIALAVREAGGQRLTETGLSLGTPQYMSPEQATGGRELDARSDVYSLAAVVYEMLAGEPPHTGATAQAVIAKLLTERPTRIRTVRDTVPEEIDSVVARALAKVPADRFGGAVEFTAALAVPRVASIAGWPRRRAASSGDISPIQTRPLGALGPPGRFPHWAAWVVAGAVVVGGAFALTLRQRAPDTIVLGKRTAVAVGQELEFWPTLFPDGRTMAYTRADTSSAEIVLQQVDGGAPVTVTTTVAGRNLYQALSPDGTRLLFSGDAGLYVMPTLGGQSRLLVPGRLPRVFWGTWAPDGQRIAYTHIDTLFTQGLDQSSRTVVATGKEVHSPAWSPDGQWIVYVEGNSRFHLNGNQAPSALKLVPATGGSSIAVTDASSHNTSPIWIPGRRALLFISDREGGRDIYQQVLKGSGTSQGPPVRITTGLNPERISLSADGRRLAWSVFTQTSNVWSIAIPTRDSVPLSQARQVTSGAQDIEVAVVSRDGVWLYYDSDRSGNFDLWRIPLAGGQPEQLTSDTTDDFAPAVSPDGRTLAFHSLRSGPDNRDVFVMPTGGGPATRVSTSPGDDRLPLWSPDGRVLSWNDGFTADSGLLLSRRGENGTWSPPVRFLGGNGAWMPDGSGLAVREARGLQLLNPSTGKRSLLLPPAVARRLTFGFSWSVDGHMLYGPIVDSLGRMSIRFITVPGGQMRTLVYSDNPMVQRYRLGYDVQGGRFYLPLVDAKLDVWVAEVEAK